MGKRQGQNSHQRVHSHHVTFLFSPPFHPSLPHTHDPVINLLEISRSLINACPPSFPLAFSFSSSIVSDSGYFLPRNPPTTILLSGASSSVFPADENEVMCRARG